VTDIDMHVLCLLKIANIILINKQISFWMVHS